MNHLQKAGSALMAVSGASNVVDGSKQVGANSRARGNWGGVVKGFATMASRALAVAVMFAQLATTRVPGIYSSE